MTVNDNPYIHTFRTSEQCYVYDVNTDKILSVPEAVHDYLSDPNNSKADKATNAFIENMKANGFLRSDRVEAVEHPATQLLPFYLKNKLRQLILQVTQSCNLRCSYCSYSGSYKNRIHSASSMSVDMAERVIDFFIPKTKDSKRVAVSFYGGEPLLNLELVKHCVRYIEDSYPRKEIDYGMTTNGTLLDDDSIAFLVEKKFNLLVSLDGPEEIHDARRRFASNGEGSFSVIMDNITRIRRLFPEYFRKNVRFNTVADTSNMFRCVDEFISGEEILDPEKFRLNYVATQYTDQEIEIKEDFSADREYEFFKLLLSKLGEFPRTKTSSLLSRRFYEIYKHCFQGMEMEQERIPPKFHHGGPCIPGALRLFVDTDGRFFPCERVSELSETAMLGDIERGISLEKATKILNLEVATHSKCKNCWVYRQCSICIGRADDLQGVSGAETEKSCPSVCRFTEETFKDYCVLRELGYDFDEEQLRGEKDDGFSFSRDARIHEVRTPVVFVLSSTENCNQSYIESALCSELRNREYDVLLISEQKDSVVLGQYPIPDFMFQGTYSENEKIIALNRYIWGLERKHQPEIIVISIPGAAMPYDVRHSSDFGVLAYEFSEAVPPDFAVLSSPCMPYEIGYFKGVEKSLHGRLGITIDIHSLSPYVLDYAEISFEKSLCYLSVDDEYVREMIKRIGYDNLLNLNHKVGISAAVDHLIDKLSGGVGSIIT
jgi:uncharacterized protein